MDEIVVVAQRRAENLQDVPLTVSVISSDRLARENIATTADLVKAVPALTVTNQGIYQIRGIGTQGFGRGAEQSVSVVLDGVVVANAVPNAMYDLDHVEVLSGPQGTLFGKNATAGVINIVTRAPVLGELQAIAHADLGSHDYTNVQLIGNIPLGEDAALRLSARMNTYGHTVFNSFYEQWDFKRDLGVRGRLLWRPSDALEINISGDYMDADSNGIGGTFDAPAVSIFTATSDPTLTGVLANCGVVVGQSNNKNCDNSVKAVGVKNGAASGLRRGGGSIQIDYDIGDYAFTSITAYREGRSGDFGIDQDIDIAGFGADGLPTNYLDRNNTPSSTKAFSQEARIQSPATESLNFVAGLYYSRMTQHSIVDQAGALSVTAPPGGFVFRRRNEIFNKNINYAVFGQVNYNINDSIEVFLGGRVTRDEISDLSFNSFSENPRYGYTGNTGFFSLYPVSSCTVAGGSPGNPPGSLFQPPSASTCPAGTSLTAPAKLSETGVSWKAGVKYKPAPDTLLFATVTQGYKGPFINDQASLPAGRTSASFADLLVVESEKPLAYEFGIKTTVLNRFAVNVTAFTSKIDNFQTTIFLPAQPPPATSVPSFVQGNAPYAITRGVDVSAFGKLTDNLSVDAGVLYNDAHFAKGFLVNCGIPINGPCPAISQLPFSPKWKAKLGGEYRHQVAEGMEGFIQADLSYSSRFPYASDQLAVFSPARYLLGARAGVRSDGGQWGVAVFCRNCLDERYPIIELANVFVPGTTQKRLSLDSYRVIGVTLDGRF